MIEIRRLTPEDMLNFQKMHVVVYNLRRDFSKEEKSNALDHPAHWAWGAFENGKFVSGMWEIDFLMRFDGKNVKMSGIGGVGTLPEARKNGLVRRIFEKLLPSAYEDGVIFSNLTPFSHDFYRLFGYELACARKRVMIPTKDFFKFKIHGDFVQIFPDSDTSALQEVHSAYIANLNHGICRDYWTDNRAWKRFIQNDPYSSGIFLYLWKNENGQAKSYIQYQDLQDGNNHKMSVLELAFVDREGLYGALSLVGGLSAQFEEFLWLMPTFIDPIDFMGNAWNIEQKIIPRDMTRVVNVKVALEKMRVPAGEGAYVLEVKDEHIKANCGKYLVEFGTQKSNVSSTQKAADIICEIGPLSQLITGYRTLENALVSRQSGLAVCGNTETLNRVFIQRPQHVTEYF